MRVLFKMLWGIASFFLVLFLSCKDDVQSHRKEGSMAKEKRKIEKTIEIAAPVRDVWQALTEAEELKQWFPLDAEVNPGLGGQIRLTWGDKFVWVFRIDAWVTEKHLKLVYDHQTDFMAGDAKEREQASMISEKSDELAIDYYLEAHSGKTRLRLVHSGFGKGANWDEEYDSVRRGWNSELMGLKHYLENHLDKERQVVWLRIPYDENEKQFWEKLMGPAGLLHLESLDELKVGDAFTIAATGETFHGQILYYDPPLDFVGTVADLNDALLRVWIEPGMGIREANVWLSAYDIRQSQVDEFERRWTEKLDELQLSYKK